MDDTHSTERDERLERLSQRENVKRVYNPRYSVFIRRIKLILPVVALAIVAIVFAWGAIDNDNIVPILEEAKAPKTVGKNELLNPRFESMDDKKQPYTITARRAVQGKLDEKIVLLEEPLADMLLNSGNWIAVEARTGAFREDNQRLLLSGDVELFHDRGYRLQMAKLNIDMDNSTAWSDTDVRGQGPAGTLEAKGLQADANKGRLIFTGPARLVLNRTASEADIGGL